MWFAYDLFTDERYGPYDTEVEALLNNKDRAVTIRFLRRKRK
jgi:hypothetical protein